MPKTLVNPATIKVAVQLACRAPSLHNSQPWRWVLDGEDLHLYLDRSRCVQATDSGGREAVISCGAALDHFKVAMAAAGWMARVERIPNPADPDHLASVDFSPRSTVTADHRRRADAILQRRTDRMPFAAPPEWAHFTRLLTAVTTDNLVAMDVIPDEARPKLAEASALSEALRIYDSAYQRELSWWTTPSTSVDGVPASALISGTESDRVDIGRSFPVVAERALRTTVQEDQAKVLALSTARDTPKNLLRCGELLSEVLLEATLAELATCTITHMLELPMSRDIVGTIVGRTHPQVLVRVGQSATFDHIPAPTPRRSLALRILPGCGVHRTTMDVRTLQLGLPA